MIKITEKDAFLEAFTHQNNRYYHVFYVSLGNGKLNQLGQVSDGFEQDKKHIQSMLYRSWSKEYILDHALDTIVYGISVNLYNWSGGTGYKTDLSGCSGAIGSTKDIGSAGIIVDGNITINNQQFAGDGTVPCTPAIWKIISGPDMFDQYSVTNTDTHFTCIVTGNEIKNNKDIYTNYYEYFNEINTQLANENKNLETEVPKCICVDLWSGCKCGAFKKEQELKLKGKK